MFLSLERCCDLPGKTLLVLAFPLLAADEDAQRERLLQCF